jgi:hypothetical protein
VESWLKLSTNLLSNETITEIQLDLLYNEYPKFAKGFKSFCDVFSEKKMIESISIRSYNANNIVIHSGLFLETIANLKSLKSFSIYDIKFQFKDILKFFKDLEKNDSLTCLKMIGLIILIKNLKEMRISQKDLKELSKIEFKNNSIKSLNLSRTNGTFENNLTFLRGIIQSKHLSHLDLKSWTLGIPGFKLLGDFLKNSSPLESLILNGKIL